MIKKLCPVLVAITMLCVATISPVRADTGIEVLENQVSAIFPAHITFTLVASAQNEIDDVRLRYSVEQDSFAPVIAEAIPQFVPGKDVEVTWQWDIKKAGGLPPGATIVYQWVIGCSGEMTTTTPRQFTFEDNRYSWQTLESSNIHLHWYSGSTDFAQELLQSAELALLRLAEDTGAHLTHAAKVYIYASADDMQQGMVFPSELAGGLAYPRQNTICIGINQSNFEWGIGALSHELAHLVTYQMTRNPYNSPPRWLDEGIAMYAQGELEPVYHSYLYQAVANDTLISVRSLCSPFSTQRDNFYLSYAESYSIVQFLSLAYGPEKLSQLLECFKEGSTTDEALLKVYGFDTAGLDSLWGQFVTQLYAPQNPPDDIPAWAIAAIATLSCAVIVIIFLIVRNTRRRRV